MKGYMELVYASACPNIGAARAALRQAFARTGVAACWREGDRKAPESPASVRGYGSPALLVNGVWNSWPHEAAASGSCVRCASRDPEGEQESVHQEGWHNSAIPQLGQKLLLRQNLAPILRASRSCDVRDREAMARTKFFLENPNAFQFVEDFTSIRCF